ncbi:hypothetical protein AA0114_g626 [Alternaria tenuissima]|jgi:hypothetical protein|uniref:Uncharacterized protein n=1 Tax=Alternaria tenuissima TaxID=119927 RepID=A0A4Q4MZ11_9PLEO|nr:hypothetical protein AA0114_g626 [Alternaria tenuissima]
MPDIESLDRCALSANTNIEHVYEDATNDTELCDNCKTTFPNILSAWLASARTVFKDEEYNELNRVIEANRQVQIRTPGVCAARLPQFQNLKLDPTGQDPTTVGKAMIDARKHSNRESRLTQPGNFDYVACTTGNGLGEICEDCNAARMDYDCPLLTALFDGVNAKFKPRVIEQALEGAAANRVMAADRADAR